MMEATLVWKLPRAMRRDLAGIWKISPGESRMKSTNEMNTGAQSCILFSFFFDPQPLLLWLKIGDDRRLTMASSLARFRDKIV